METSDIKETLDQALYWFTRKHPFFGALLQEINMKINHTFPTACVYYNDKVREYNMVLNPDFFMNLKLEERIAILKHEILHLSHGHLTRFQDKINNEKSRKQANFAMDLAINQMIPEPKEGSCPEVILPENCLDINKFTYINKKTNKKEAFPKLRPAEEYYELLQNQECFMELPKRGDKGGHSDPNGKPDQGESSGDGELTPDKDGHYNVNDVIDNQMAGTLDEHKWDELSEDEKQKMLESMKEMFKRAIDKVQNGKSDIPGYVNDLIKELENNINNLNYKQILKNALKKTITAQDRQGTWKRPSKRYGHAAPGSELGKLPEINFYQDTSGSMSYREICEFFNVIDQFGKVGNKRFTMGFWHTELYKVKKYKNVKDVKQDEIQSGGTDVTQVLEHISKTKPNLAIILTDGEYYNKYEKLIKDVEIIWVISKQGSTNHPLEKTVGKTIGLKGIINN